MRRTCVDVKKNWMGFSNNSGASLVKKKRSLNSVCKYPDIDMRYYLSS